MPRTLQQVYQDLHSIKPANLPTQSFDFSGYEFDDPSAVNYINRMNGYGQLNEGVQFPTQYTSTDIGSRPTNYPIEYYLGGPNGTSTDIGAFNSLAPVIKTDSAAQGEWLNLTPTKQTQAQPPAKAPVSTPKPTVTVPRKPVTPKSSVNTGKDTTELPSNQDKGNSNGPDKNSLDWLNQLLPYLLAGGIGYYMGK